MSTIILNIVIIIAIILVGGYIAFILACLLFPGDEKKDGKVDVNYDDQIKNLEERQKNIYDKLLSLQDNEKYDETVVTIEKILAPKEETKEEVKEEIKEEPVKEEIVEAPVNEIPVEVKKNPTRRRSFALKLASSTESTKKYFSDITNKLRLYGLTARIGKSKVMFRANKEVYAKMIFKGKRIVLCLPLNPKSEKFDLAVYKQLDLSEKKGFEDLAFGIKITNKKVVELIYGLIDEVVKKFDLIENPKFKEIDYVEKYPDIYSDFEKKGYGYLLKTEVLKEDVEKYDDSFADKIIIEEKSDEVAPKRLIKAEISISDFNNRYTDTSVAVDMDRLKNSDLIGKNTNYLVVKASSRIDKPFTVYAHEFEPDAVKMICIAGGKAVKIVYSENN